ncbi:hypothetical protein BCP78_0119 [Bacillus phage BCP78]|uniref:Uncharacterized protein n=3 Tax=Tsarbombavirus BCP78 TaxID=1985182 RepID=J9PRY5_9CAUD|nr:hypothetical protein BCP78_0119 [Bacillus phage BCP78]YP_009783482.1 hypothetical protein QLX27_gp109 [Bacillus phage BCU4]AEW47126.1 hypothetical protein BCP78_0119 [Bacillus phage BCP78]AEW47615.1 hypothetical protein BCU4_0109 [Bacillus phage BCU4]AQN32498.1 hypothetical protein BCP12_080 [Bacillus phage BCP12]
MSLEKERVKVRRAATFHAAIVSFVITNVYGYTKEKPKKDCKNTVPMFSEDGVGQTLIRLVRIKLSILVLKKVKKKIGKLRGDSEKRGK